MNRKEIMFLLAGWGIALLLPPSRVLGAFKKKG